VSGGNEGRQRHRIAGGRSEQGTECDSRDTHKTKSVYTRVLLDVFRQVSTRDPFRNKLERGGSDAEEADNIFVFQVFPYYGLLTEGLLVLSARTDREGDDINSVPS